MLSPWMVLSEIPDVEKLTSILVVADRTDSDRWLLDKAVLLARNLGAQIHLFSCAADTARALRHTLTADEAEKVWQTSVAEHLGYLEKLRTEVETAGVHVGLEAVCNRTPSDAILAKVEELRPDLVMKRPSGSHPLRRFSLDWNDWRLARDCPVTLMLTGARRWRSSPQFAALVNVSEQGTLRLPEAIIHTSLYFALGCHAQLDVVYSEQSDDPDECAERATMLERLTREYRIDARHVRTLRGDPDRVLPQFVDQQGYDALVLGALTHRRGLAALNGALTSNLVEAVDCDFILVKPGDGREATVVRAPLEADACDAHPVPADEQQQHAHARSREATVLWQALFGD